MPKPTLTQAIMELYDSIPTDAPALPTLYNEYVPEDLPQIPAAYFLHAGEVPDSYNARFIAPTGVMGRFSIVIFQVGIPEVEALAVKLMRWFIPLSVQIQDSITSLFRTNYTPRGTQWRNKDGDQVHMAKIDYECRIANPTF